MMRIKFHGAVAVLAAAAVLSPPLIANADHQWSSYHWKRTTNDPLTLTVGDNHIPVSPANTNWSLILGDVVANWDLFAGSYLAFQLVGGGGGDIESYNDNYGNNGWLGLARISITRGKNKHIVAGEAFANDYYVTLSGYTGFDEPIEWQHVVCQEVGHTDGLDHNREGPDGGVPDDTCMNDQTRPLRYPLPNVHDTDQLDEMYAHVHGDGGGGGKPPKCHPKKGCSGAAHAIWAERYDSEAELFEASDLVVQARVLSSRFSHWVGRPGRAVPMTRVQLRVNEAWKGNPGRTVRLEQTRGQGFEIADDPGYAPGQRYLLYLRRAGSGVYRIVNPQGRIPR